MIRGDEMKYAALWVVWWMCAFFSVLVFCAMEDKSIVHVFALAGCVLHYFTFTEKTGL